MVCLESPIGIVRRLEINGIFKDETNFLRHLRRFSSYISDGNYAYYRQLQILFLGLIEEEYNQHLSIYEPGSRTWMPFYVEDKGIGRLIKMEDSP